MHYALCALLMFEGTQLPPPDLPALCKHYRLPPTPSLYSPELLCFPWIAATAEMRMTPTMILKRDIKIKNIQGVPKNALSELLFCETKFEGMWPEFRKCVFLGHPIIYRLFDTIWAQ